MLRAQILLKIMYYDIDTVLYNHTHTLFLLRAGRSLSTRDRDPQQYICAGSLGSSSGS